MEFLHPAMQKAMRGHIPACFQAAQHSRKVPPCPAEHFARTYQHPELGELVCHFYGEPAEPENGWPALLELRAAYAVSAPDIADRLLNSEVRAIEAAAMVKNKEAA